ncbi:MAG TPA: membrane protein insertase YidC [Planctomycetota bacterium]|nr:membrane protein insertase YidC [Planctomycetota bacterium]
MIDPPPPPSSAKVKVFDSTMILSGFALMIGLFVWITWIGPYFAKKNAPPAPVPANLGTPSVATGPNGQRLPGATPVVPTVPPVNPAVPGGVGPVLPNPAGPVGPVAPAGVVAGGDPATDLDAGAARRQIDISTQSGRIQAVVSTAGGALRRYDIAEPRMLPGEDPRLTMLDALQREPYDRMSLAIAEVDYKLDAKDSWTAIGNFDQRVYRVVPVNGQDVDAQSGYQGRPAKIVTLETHTALFTLTRKFVFFETVNNEQPDHVDSEITFTAAATVPNLWIRYKLRGAAGILPDGPREEPVSRYSIGMGRAFTLTSVQGESTLRKQTQAELIKLEDAKDQGNLTSGELNLWTGIQNRFFSAILVPYEPAQDAAHPDQIFVFYADPIRPEWLYKDADNPRYGGGKNGQGHILETEVGVKRDRKLAGGVAQTDHYALYVGPSSQDRLKNYDRLLTVRPEGLAPGQGLELDRNIEYSGFHWLDMFARGLVWFLDMLQTGTGSFGLSVILLTVLVKLAMFPVSRNTVVAGEKQKLLQPYMAALKKLYEGKDDTVSKTKMQQEVMALYRMNKANPLASCLPMLVTIPVFLALYDSFYANYQMRHVGFLGFIGDLCEPDRVFPIYLDQVWSALPHWFNLLPVLYLGLTYLQMSMTPQPAQTDPNAPNMKYMTKLMPLMMFVFFYAMPSGLVLYFTASSAYGICENRIIRRFFYKPVPVEAPAHLKKMVEKMQAEQQAAAQSSGLGLAAQS